MTTSTATSTPTGCPTTAAETRSVDIEVLLDRAGVGFQVIHDGPGSWCDACPPGLDVAA